MNVVKKIIISLPILTSSLAYAGTMGPICQEGNVTIPCPSNAWDIGVQALYLHANYSSNATAGIYVQSPDTAKWIVPDPGWGWGFRLEGGYFYDQGSDLNLNWSHINFTTNKLIPFTDYAGTENTLVSAQFKPRWDAVNGELGQMVNFGTSKSIRFHGGAQFAQIISNFSFPSAAFPVETAYLKFIGFGPRIGADMQYRFRQGFSIYANGASALLVGSSKFNVVSSGILAPPPESVNYLAPTTVVIPQLEGKLGASYNYISSIGQFNIDAGYWWLNYINAQANSFWDMVAASDFTLNGPYFGVRWVG